MLKTIEHGLKNFYRPRLLPSALRALQAQTKNLTTVESAVAGPGGNHVVSQAARATSPRDHS